MSRNTNSIITDSNGIDMKLFGKIFQMNDFQNMNGRKFMRLIGLFMAELLATCFYVFLGCTCILTFRSGSPIDYLVICITFGLAIGSVIMIFGHISDSVINPVIALAAVVCGRMSIVMFVIYVIAEIIGGILGAVLVMVISPHGFFNAENDAEAALACCSVPRAKITPLQAFIAEIFASFILVLAVCATWDFRNAGRQLTVAIKYCIVIISISIPTGFYTGGSLNPARAFGPALVTWYWKDHWVYWCGPLLGGFLSALLYTLFFKPSYTTKKDKEEFGRFTSILEELEFVGD